jgi:hypothetical protein
VLLLQLQPPPLLLLHQSVMSTSGDAWATASHAAITASHFG